MLAIDCMPFNTVENPGFQRLLSIAMPNYELKSEKTFRTRILNEAYEKYRKMVKEKVESAQDVSLTIDAWSSKAGKHHLLCITAHFLNENLKPIYFILDTIPIFDKHTAANMSKLLDEALEFYNIKNIHLVMRDAASSIKAAVKLSGYESFDCFLHKLQLVSFTVNLSYILFFLGNQRWT